MSVRSQACEDLLDQLAEYFDEEASEAICRSVEEHMAICADCTAMINTLRRTIDLVHAMPGVSPLPEDLRRRLFRRLELDDLIARDSPE